MSGQARARARQNKRMGRLEGRPLTDHKEAKVDHWTIQETGRLVGGPGQEKVRYPTGQAIRTRSREENLRVPSRPDQAD